MKKNFMLIVALAAVLFFVTPMTSKAADSEGEWKTGSNGWWYELSDGTYYKDGFYEISGDWYYFDAAGWMKTGWLKLSNQWYYLNEDGTRATGWKNVGGTWYYLAEERGYMYEGGTYEIDGTWYLLDDNGAWKHAQGWNTTGSSWYYIKENDEFATGWEFIGGQWYYFELPNSEYYGKHYGQMFSGEGRFLDNGSHYYFRYDGSMVTGWYSYADAGSSYGNWVYCNADGTAYIGWLSSGGYWYYLDNGYMYVDGMKSIYNEKTRNYDNYCFDKDGHMVYGWYNEVYSSPSYSYSYWYYMDPATGLGYDGWVLSGGRWYYIDDGHMLTGMVYDSKAQKFYVCGTDGAMISGGWYAYTTSAGTTWYYANTDGTGYDGWLQSGGKWYYIDKGEMVTNRFVDGYWIGADGVWA